MKAVAVFPGKPNSAHLRDVPKPSIASIPEGRGVLVKVLRVGLDGTDKEINAGEYGSPPPDEDFLIIGHESFGIVEETGPAVADTGRGDYVVGTVNANRENFETAVKDLAHCEIRWPGWLSNLLTHPVEGLERYAEAIKLLGDGTDVVKVFVNVSERQ